MKVLYGVTPNLCESIGGYLPFYVRMETTGPKVAGTHWQAYSSGTFASTDEAIDAARQLAIGWSDEVEFTEGCVRCWGDARHVVRNDDRSVSCGCCKRLLRTPEEEEFRNALQESLLRACLAVTRGQCFGLSRK